VGRVWCFRLVAMVLGPILVLVAFETALRAAGYGHPARFVVTAQGPDGPRLVNNPYFTYSYFEPQLAKTCVPFSVSAVKPAEGYRIVVFGGSAAQGVPAEAYSFARILEVLLRDQFPGVEIDVVNTAMTAINSHVVRSIARGCRDLQADLAVVYMGNNEVIGPYGAGTVFAPLTRFRWLISVSTAVKATRSGQLVLSLSRRINEPRPESWTGMKMFLASEVASDDPRLETVYRHFESNLEDIALAMTSTGTPVVLSTVGVNLKDCQPFRSRHSSSLSTGRQQTWEDAFAAGSSLQDSGQPRQAIQHYRRAEAIDVASAALQYRIGRCHQELGELDSAHDHYVRARDLDTLRFRADSHINDTIRRVATRLAPRGVHLVDVEETLERQGDEQTPGSPWFWEHVHLRFPGNYLIARAIHEQVLTLTPSAMRAHATGSPPPSQEECEKRLAYTEWDRYTIGSRFVELLSGPPFSDRLYPGTELTELRSEVEALRVTVSEIGFDRLLARYDAAIEDPQTHWLVRDRYASLLMAYAESLRPALARCRAALRLNRRGAQLSTCLFYRKEYARSLRVAEAEWRLALERCPENVEVLLSLARTLQRQRRVGEANQVYREAFAAAPRESQVWQDLKERLGP